MMQEKKNKQRVVLLIVLIVMTAGALIMGSQSRNVSVDKTIFKKTEYDKVDKVRIVSADDTTELTFNGARWRVNGEYADRNLITVMFATLQQAEPKRNLPSSIRDSVANAMDRSGAKVTLYANNEEVQSFIAAGNENKTQSFFKEHNSKDVYVMTIPGYRVYVSGIFELNESGWRDKYLFGSFNWRNFKSLEAKFSDKPSENFLVEPQADNLIVIKGIQTDTAKLNAFMYDFSMIMVDEYAGAGKLADSLSQVKSFVTVTLRDIGNHETTLSLFRENGKTVPGLINGTQAVLFDTRQVAKILRPKSFFVRK